MPASCNASHGGRCRSGFHQQAVVGGCGEAGQADGEHGDDPHARSAVSRSWAGVEGRGVSAALAPSPRYRPQSHHCSRLRKRGPAAPGPGARQQALQQAVREELISRNVAKLVRVPSPRYKNRQRPFSVDRVPTILGAVKGTSKRPPAERAAPADSRDTVRATRRTRCPSWSGMANEVVSVEDSVVVEGKRRSLAALLRWSGMVLVSGGM